MADQFSLRVRRLTPPTDNGNGFPGSDPPVAQVLSAECQSGSMERGLLSWQWGMRPSCATYCALFPRAWHVYDEPVKGVQLTCRQISPVFPHEYRESSLPAAVFVWTVKNTGDRPAEVSLMFSFQNGAGTPNDKAGGHSNRPFTRPATENQSAKSAEAAPLHSNVIGAGAAVVGVELRHQHRQKKVYHTDSEHEDNRTHLLCGYNKSKLGGTPQHYSDPLAFAIAARAEDGGVDISRCSRFSVSPPKGGGKRAMQGSAAPTAAQLWEGFVREGRLPEECGGSTNGHPQGGGAAGAQESAPGEAIAAALCQKVVLAPGETRELVFSLAWDMPLARFGGGHAVPKRYTRFFGRGGEAAPEMAAHALRSHERWEGLIERWQKPILEDPHLPSFYKYTLFNELYFVTDGGTLWLDTEDGRPNPQGEAERDPLLDDGEAEKDRECSGVTSRIGQFLYLEGHEYLMYNTYDVHFYASFALAMLWPSIQLSIQRDIAQAVQQKDAVHRTLLGEGDWRPRKVKGVVPHDVGSPSEAPWQKLNAYVFQDVSRWKDLGPKFVLQVYRDYVASGSFKFLEDLWDSVKQVMTTTETFDLDGDGLIENSGFPDQTFDIWTVTGPSAYTGGLWVASVSAAAKISEILGKEEERVYFTALLGRAKAAYRAALWNGEYFNYDSSGGGHSDSIMADQMAGQWYTRACGLEPVVDDYMARSSLKKIYDCNVQMFGNGRLGAVNGMRPDGKVDNTCLQSREVWTGVTYACGAAMLHEAAVALEGLPNPQWGAQEGDERRPSMYAKDLNENTESERLDVRASGEALRKAAFETIRGLHDAGWNDFGYWFQMPEGWEQSGNYRSLGYMRSLAAWAMQWAVEHESLIMKNVNITDEGDMVFQPYNRQAAVDALEEMSESQSSGEASSRDMP